MQFSIVYLIGGFASLFFGADWMVKGASSLARSTGVRPVIIALTIVAFGTSAPELMVSVNASIHNTPDIAIGNIIGSMIANMGLILGIAALVRPIKIEFRLLKKEVPILILCEIFFLIIAWNLYISRIEGVVLLAGFALFNWYCMKEAVSNIRENANIQEEYRKSTSGRQRPNRINVFLIILGIGSLLLGSHLAVKGAIGLAQIFRISPFIIAASVVAFGTSLPELATSVVAAARGEFDISVGNVLGSNIFNILMCIGAAAVAMPLRAEKMVIHRDAVFMLGLSILLGIFMWTRMKIGRVEGIILLLAYCGYIMYLFH